jgi:hypothetical protein
LDLASQWSNTSCPVLYRVFISNWRPACDLILGPASDRIPLTQCYIGQIFPTGGQHVILSADNSADELLCNMCYESPSTILSKSFSAIYEPPHVQ